MEGALRDGERGVGVCMHDRKLALASYKEKRGSIYVFVVGTLG